MLLKNEVVKSNSKGKFGVIRIFCRAPFSLASSVDSVDQFAACDLFSGGRCCSPCLEERAAANPDKITTEASVGEATEKTGS